MDAVSQPKVFDNTALNPLLIIMIHFFCHVHRSDAVSIFSILSFSLWQLLNALSLNAKTSSWLPLAHSQFTKLDGRNKSEEQSPCKCDSSLFSFILKQKTPALLNPDHMYSPNTSPQNIITRCNSFRVETQGSRSSNILIDCSDWKGLARRVESSPKTLTEMFLIRRVTLPPELVLPLS